MVKICHNDERKSKDKKIHRYKLVQILFYCHTYKPLYLNHQHHFSKVKLGSSHPKHVGEIIMIVEANFPGERTFNLISSFSTVVTSVSFEVFLAAAPVSVNEFDIINYRFEKRLINIGGLRRIELRSVFVSF